MASKLLSSKTIGTHSGTFHCDEALGCFLLRRTKAFGGANLIRTRDESVLSKLDVVIDVGGVYDHNKNRYDHHQRGFSEVFGMGGFNTVKLSSAGLVYKHFGKEVISTETGLPLDHPDTEVGSSRLALHLSLSLFSLSIGVACRKKTDLHFYS